MLRHNPLSVPEHTLCAVLGCCGFCVLHDIAMHMKIRGLSFSWKRAVGITAAKQKIKQEDRIAYNQTGTGKKNRQVCTELYFGKQKETNMT